MELKNPVLVRIRTLRMRGIVIDAVRVPRFLRPNVYRFQLLSGGELRSEMELRVDNTNHLLDLEKEIDEAMER
jgi:hypothetical protein